VRQRGGWGPRWATVAHGGVLGGLMAGVCAVWATLALTAALLVTPVETMQSLERKGAWGLGDAVRQGSVVLVSLVGPGREARR